MSRTFSLRSLLCSTVSNSITIPRSTPGNRETALSEYFIAIPQSTIIPNPMRMTNIVDMVLENLIQILELQCMNHPRIHQDLYILYQVH